MKLCLDCQQHQPLDLFNKDKSRHDGLAAYCRPCFKVRRDKWYHANSAAVRLQQMEAVHLPKRSPGGVKSIPPWFDAVKVATMYSKAHDMGLTVDHIVPIKSDKVCGLHTWENLQLLSLPLNASKQNRHWPDSPHESL